MGGSSTNARSLQAYTAYALFKAFEGVGTDNDRVTRLLGGTDKKKMGAVASYYLSTYGNSLVEDLKDELSGTFLKVNTCGCGCRRQHACLTALFFKSMAAPLILKSILERVMCHVRVRAALSRVASAASPKMNTA